MQWVRDIFSPSNVWSAFKYFFPTAAGVVSVWLSWVLHLPASVTLLLAVLTAACILIILDFAQAWFDKRNSLLQRIAELEGQLRELRAAADQSTDKRKLLDQISELYREMIDLRIEMEQHPQRLSDTDWDRKLGELQKRIGAKIDQFSSKAEANAYQYVGNLPRPINTN